MNQCHKLAIVRKSRGTLIVRVLSGTSNRVTLEPEAVGKLLQKCHSYRE